MRIWLSHWLSSVCEIKRMQNTFNWLPTEENHCLVDGNWRKITMENFREDGGSGGTNHHPTNNQKNHYQRAEKWQHCGQSQEWTPQKSTQGPHSMHRWCNGRQRRTNCYKTWSAPEVKFLSHKYVVQVFLIQIAYPFSWRKCCLHANFNDFRLLPTTKNRGQFLRNNYVKNVIRFATSNILHCEDRAIGGFEHVGSYCAVGGPHKNSYRKPIYTPAKCMNISSKA